MAPYSFIFFFLKFMFTENKTHTVPRLESLTELAILMSFDFASCGEHIILLLKILFRP